MIRHDRPRRRTSSRLSAAVFVVAFGTATLAFAGPSAAQVSEVSGGAFGYYTSVSLFGGPQVPQGPAPTVTLPPGGSADPIVATDPDGAVAQYGPARIFSGRWPEHVGSAPPSGPITVSTQGTPADGSVTSSVDIVLRNPPDPDSPGGFGPGPIEGDELHSTCTATETGVTGSVRFVNALLSTSTDSEGSPLDQEPIPDAPAPNFERTGEITNVGDSFRVVFNEQTINGDGSITVNAYHMYLLGPTAVGEMIVGQVRCATTAGAGEVSLGAGSGPGSGGGPSPAAGGSPSAGSGGGPSPAQAPVAGSTTGTPTTTRAPTATTPRTTATTSTRPPSSGSTGTTTSRTVATTGIDVLPLSLGAFALVTTGLNAVLWAGEGGGTRRRRRRESPS